MNLEKWYFLLAMHHLVPGITGEEHMCSSEVSFLFRPQGCFETLVFHNWRNIICSLGSV